MAYSNSDPLPCFQDAGFDGLSSHWEARVLQGSIMAASLAEPSLVRIDPVTLAALQDTGWYSVNFSRAQSLVWGDGKTFTDEFIESANQMFLYLEYVKIHFCFINIP